MVRRINISGRHEPARIIYFSGNPQLFCPLSELDIA